MKEIIFMAVIGVILLVITHFLSWCSIKKIKLLGQVSNLLKLIPSGRNLNCKGNKVYIVKPNGIDEEWIYTGIYIWQNDKKMNVEFVRERIANKKRAKTIFLIMMIILSIVSIYLGLVIHGAFFIFPAITLIEQFFPFYIGPDIFGIAQDSL